MTTLAGVQPTSEFGEMFHYSNLLRGRATLLPGDDGEQRRRDIIPVG